MGARRTARERALQALFQLDAGSNSTAGEALESAWSASADDGKRDPESEGFALELVEGVRGKLTELDALLTTHSQNWRLERMSRIDRNVLRLGAFELTSRQDIPKKVTLNEAIELGRKFGSEDSSAFINGILDKLAESSGKS